MDRYLELGVQLPHLQKYYRLQRNSKSSLSRYFEVNRHVLQKVRERKCLDIFFFLHLYFRAVKDEEGYKLVMDKLKTLLVF